LSLRVISLFPLSCLFFRGEKYSKIFQFLCPQETAKFTPHLKSPMTDHTSPLVHRPESALAQGHSSPKVSHAVKEFTAENTYVSRMIRSFLQWSLSSLSNSQQGSAKIFSNVPAGIYNKKKTWLQPKCGMKKNMLFCYIPIGQWSLWTFSTTPGVRQ
jgi:hypothetical protein